tara:strand:+ start:66757 stop:67320 length:564 start_codon:yes stop_codon:yes gene_type:complete
MSCDRVLLWAGTVYLTIGMLSSMTALAQTPEISDAAKGFCDAHAALPENKPYETQIATDCYQWAAKNPAAVESLDPEAVNGLFRFGNLICNRGYWKGYDQEGGCDPLPNVDNGRFAGNTLKCDKGFLLIVDRAGTPENPLLIDEMACTAVPADRANSMNKCPRGTVAVKAMSQDDRQRYPYGTDCAR